MNVVFWVLRICILREVILNCFWKITLRVSSRELVEKLFSLNSLEDTARPFWACTYSTPTQGHRKGQRREYLGITCPLYFSLTNLRIVRLWSRSKIPELCCFKPCGRHKVSGQRTWFVFKNRTILESSWNYSSSMESSTETGQWSEPSTSGWILALCKIGRSASVAIM